MTNDTETLTLTDFLLARIAEDEAWAGLAQHSSDLAPWHQGMGPVKGNVISHAGLGIAETRASNVARFISMHDPVRVLAECEAKRRAVGDYQAVLLRPALADDDTVKGYMAALEGVLTDLAAVYADHPDFRNEWR